MWFSSPDFLANGKEQKSVQIFTRDETRGLAGDFDF
jgi:hypothetical protein